MEQEKEIWKPVVGYDGYYEVSNLGRVKSIGRYCLRRGGSVCWQDERILKPQNSSCGYLQVGLYNDCKYHSCKIHRLVAQAFIPNPNNLPMINHKDECKTNNMVDNLEWCDAKYNINYGNRNEKSSHGISKKVLCLETGVIYPSGIEASIQLGINNGSISQCCNGKLKTAGGYHWKFVS